MPPPEDPNWRTKIEYALKLHHHGLWTRVALRDYVDRDELYYLAEHAIGALQIEPPLWITDRIDPTLASILHEIREPILE